ncbi:cystathionine gamma-synthase [Thozetella sp. PMI_491]|nr:cystathionine gamma-synthase [Thozetella sp. PMI_491]
MMRHPSSNEGSHSLATSFEHELSISSRAIHADDYINSHRAVAPPIHVSTTFRYNSDPDKLGQGGNIDPNAPHDSHTYSRDTAPNTTRLETLLTSVLKGPSLTYSSGLAAFHAMLIFLNPSRIAIGHGYHGCHGVVALLQKLKPLEQLTHSDLDLEKLQPGDVLHVETPFNPTGEAVDLSYYRRIATQRGAWLTCDATFAPPPLQDPFVHGVDIVMHSGTKYLGGHSDILCGVLTVRPDLEETKRWIDGLRKERVYLGSVMGSLEGWLGVRSMRTLELRIERQSRSAGELVGWLESARLDANSPVRQLVAKLLHASLQPEAKNEASWLRKQMPRGYGSVFALVMTDEQLARRLPSKLNLFHHATSLGGVESLIEWRAISDASIDRRLLRVNVGVEGTEDLKADMLQAFMALLAERGELVKDEK